jgi:hypothetical protein
MLVFYITRLLSLTGQQGVNLHPIQIHSVISDITVATEIPKDDLSPWT